MWECWDRVRKMEDVGWQWVCLGCSTDESGVGSILLKGIPGSWPLLVLSLCFWVTMRWVALAYHMLPATLLPYKRHEASHSQLKPLKPWAKEIFSPYKFGILQKIYSVDCSFSNSKYFCVWWRREENIEFSFGHDKFGVLVAQRATIN